MHAQLTDARAYITHETQFALILSVLFKKKRYYKQFTKDTVNITCKIPLYSRVYKSMSKYNCQKQNTSFLHAEDLDAQNICFACFLRVVYLTKET